VVTLPQENASRLRVRISWSESSVSLWECPAHELRIAVIPIRAQSVGVIVSTPSNSETSRSTTVRAPSPLAV
jgi:hypothetical protein